MNQPDLFGLAAAPLLNLMRIGLFSGDLTQLFGVFCYHDPFDAIMVTVCLPLGMSTEKSHGPVQSYCELVVVGFESQCISLSVWNLIWLNLLPDSGASKVATHPPSNHPCTLKCHFVSALSLTFMSNLYVTRLGAPSLHTLELLKREKSASSVI